MVATKYPISQFLDKAAFNGVNVPYPLPTGWSLRDSGWPADWVRDQGTNAIMPLEKFEQLAVERRAYAAELARQHVAQARAKIKELEPQLRQKTADLKALISDLVATNPDDVATFLGVMARTRDTVLSRVAVVSSIAAQRATVESSQS